VRQFQYFLRITILAFFIFLIIACSRYESTIEGDCSNTIKLVNENITMFDSNQDRTLLDASLELLENCKEIDNSNQLLYYTESNIYVKQKKYEKAIISLKTIANFKQPHGNLYLQIGFLYELLNHKETSKSYYEKAKVEYLNDLEKKPDDITPMINLMFLKLFTNNKEVVLKEYENLLQEYPNNEEIMFIKNYINDLSKEKYLNIDINK
jgi:tetratricopeptide (TPR) repeat protein